MDMLEALDEFVAKTGRRESMKPHRRRWEYLDPLTMPSELVEEEVEGQENRISGNNVRGIEQGGGQGAGVDDFASLDQNPKWRRQNDGFI